MKCATKLRNTQPSYVVYLIFTKSSIFYLFLHLYYHCLHIFFTHSEKNWYRGLTNLELRVSDYSFLSSIIKISNLNEITSLDRMNYVMDVKRGSIMCKWASRNYGAFIICLGKNYIEKKSMISATNSPLPIFLTIL